MLIFTYGTLTLPLIRDRVLGHPVDTAEAVLRGYSKVCGWDYLTLIPSDGEVRGLVFEADERDIGLMDIWEDVPVYELVPVRAEVSGEEVTAHAYIMPEPPAHYEVVGGGCIAAIPIDEIIEDMERLMGARRRAFLL